MSHVKSVTQSDAFTSRFSFILKQNYLGIHARKWMKISLTVQLLPNDTHLKYIDIFNRMFMG